MSFAFINTNNQFCLRAGRASWAGGPEDIFRHSFFLAHTIVHGLPSGSHLNPGRAGECLSIVRAHINTPLYKSLYMLINAFLNTHLNTSFYVYILVISNARGLSPD